MYIQEISLHDFRNIESCRLIPCRGVNVICGQNAQGKTNLLEAIWLFTGAKSFRMAKDAQMIRWDSPYADLNLSFFSEKREQTARITISAAERKKIWLNEIEKKSASALIGNFCAVVFSPAHLSLVKGAPAERRRFLDTAICQLHPTYIQTLAGHQRALAQRNALLRDVRYHSELIDTLDYWDSQLVLYGTQIFLRRHQFIRDLSIKAGKIYRGISSDREELTLGYHSVFLPQEETDENSPDFYKEAAHRYEQMLRAGRRQDLVTGTTAVGAHRDDLLLRLDGMPAREYGSQGQQRSTALALKLGECDLFGEALGEAPVILLDDVMSELDDRRQKYILQNIKDRQVFITCCDGSLFAHSRGACFFRAKDGIFQGQ